MSDAQLDRMVEQYYDRLLDKYLQEDDMRCKHCTHYCKRSNECEREDENGEEYYVSVMPDDDACDRFEADEYEPETDW